MATPWPIRQKVRRQGAFAPLRPLVGTRFQVLFTPLPGVLFTFPSRYFFTIGLPRVLSLGWRSTRIPWVFREYPGTWERAPGRDLPFAYGAFTLYGVPFQALRLGKSFVTPRGGGGLLRTRPATRAVQRPPAFTHRSFGLIPFRSPLLRESLFAFLSWGY